MGGGGGGERQRQQQRSSSAAAGYGRYQVGCRRNPWICMISLVVKSYCCFAYVVRIIISCARGPCASSSCAPHATSLIRTTARRNTDANHNDTEAHREVPPVLAGLAAAEPTSAASAAIAPHGAPTAPVAQQLATLPLKCTADFLAGKF